MSPLSNVTCLHVSHTPGVWVQGDPSGCDSSCGSGLHLAGYTELLIRNAAAGKTLTQEGLNKDGVANVLTANNVAFANTESSAELRAKLDQLLTDTPVIASGTPGAVTCSKVTGCNDGDKPAAKLCAATPACGGWG